MNFENTLDLELELKWIDFNGREIDQGTIMPLSEASRETFIGHVFRVKANELLLEYKVSRETSAKKKVQIVGCGSVKENPRSTERDEEFAKLMHPLDKPCEGPSSQWSCVRYLTVQDLEKRSKFDYGIQPNETKKRGYATVDDSYTQQIGKIPKVTPSPGYAKMSFTEPLKDLLHRWYFQRRNDSMKEHDVIPGGYTNNDVVKIDKIDLDQYTHIQRSIIREMRQILEWWTAGIKLKHTSTFGIRIYRRNSVLINHVDRMDTHLASAVIHIHQEGVDQGWPLELYLPDNRVAEVYLQPMEIILYEGAWLRHGRPMRFQGQEFANVFSHFAPPDWYGPKGDSTNRYFGIPPNRLTTLADPPHRILSSDFLDKQQQLHHRQHSSQEL